MRITSGGLHLFTLKSLQELVRIPGLAEMSHEFQFPYGTDFKLLKDRLKSPIGTLEIPPPEIGFRETFMSIHFPGHIDIRGDYMEFLANKIIMVCGHGRDKENVPPTTVGSLQRRRSRSGNG